MTLCCAETMTDMQLRCQRSHASCCWEVGIPRRPPPRGGRSDQAAVARCPWAALELNGSRSPTRFIEGSARQACWPTPLSNRGVDDRDDEGPVVAALVDAGGASGCPFGCGRPDWLIDGVGIDLDAALVEEAGEALSAIRTMSYRFCERRASQQVLQLLPEPRLHCKRPLTTAATRA